VKQQTSAISTSLKQGKSAEKAKIWTRYDFNKTYKLPSRDNG
jgi:hypothetical protein